MVQFRRGHKAFTLVELLTSIVIFSLVTGSILAIVTVSTGYWKRGNNENDAKEGVRVAFQVILAELSQAVIDPDPGGGHPSTGYLGITPSITSLTPPYNQATAILLPNANNPTTPSSSLIFNEANVTECSLTSVPPCIVSGGTAPLYYRQVQYSVVEGNILQRQETDYDGSGNAISTITDPVVQIKNGTLAIKATYVSAGAVNLQFTSQGNGQTYSLSSYVYIPGGQQ